MRKKRKRKRKSDTRRGGEGERDLSNPNFSARRFERGFDLMRFGAAWDRIWGVGDGGRGLSGGFERDRRRNGRVLVVGGAPAREEARWFGSSRSRSWFLWCNFFFLFYLIWYDFFFFSVFGVKSVEISLTFCVIWSRLAKNLFVIWIRSAKHDLARKSHLILFCWSFFFFFFQIYLIFFFYGLKS